MTKRCLNLGKVAIIIVICSLVTILYIGCKNSSTKPSDDHPEIGMTYHDNDVYIWTFENDPDGNLTGYPYTAHPWSVRYAWFTLQAFDVTSGQDPDHNLQVGNYYQAGMSECNFTFRVGRKASSQVANSFNATCPPAHNTFNHEADELNFWVKGTLVLELHNGQTFSFPNTVFAQGHSGASNNWWFGNDTLTNSSQAQLIWDPYSTTYSVPLPIYMGDRCFGFVSPQEDPNLVFKFLRGEGALGNSRSTIGLIGVYTRQAPTGPWE